MSKEHSTAVHHGKHRPKLTQGTTQRSSREPSDNLLSYYESPLANEGKNYARPASPPAKPPSARILRKMSTTSTSSSDYSYDSETTDLSGKATGSEASSVTRRSRTPSQGGADRRRVAIVQMETLNEATSKSSSSGRGSASSIRSRRGYESNLSGLALVAPPDAAPRSYTDLTPPSTAPISGKNFLYYERDHLDKGHQRSTSEVVLPKKTSPRDVGIVGTARNAVISESRSSTENKNRKDKKDKENNNNHTLQPPIFQRPSKSRSPSPIPNSISEKLEDEANMLSPVSAYYKTMNPRPMIPPIVTPEIGEGKDIHVPVAAPVVVSLHSTVQIKNSPVLPSGTDTPNTLGTSQPVPIPESSSFLHYQPGVHATAGPLPPPPRAAFSIDARSPPPPRPPRLNSPNPPRTRGDIEVVKHALQLPPSVSAVLSSKLPEVQPLKIHKDVKGDISHSASSRDSHVSMAQSVHSLEGAFPLSIVNEESRTSTPSIHPPPILDVAKVEEEVIDQPPEPETSDVYSVTVDDIPEVIVDEVPAPPGTDSGHSWIDVERELSPSPEGKNAAFLDHSRGGSSPNGSHSQSISHEAPSPPPKSLRSSLTTNLKRFSSLPRTPSLSSRSNRRTSSGTNYSSRTPSPSIHHAVKPHRPKIRSRDPAALFCHEVFSQRTPMERCIIYATKINELYLHDCGLSDWVAEMKDRGPNGQRASSQHQFTSQPRQTSRSSVISEMTFPRRPDASAATDLSHGAYHEITPSRLPPTLPYPSLAVHPPRSSPSRSNSTVGSGTAPSSIRSLASSNSASKTAGFFASLGRKASISSAKRERLGPLAPTSTTGSGKLLTKNPSTISRPINTNNNPTVPGGPRAPPNRAQRSQTLMTTTSSHSPSPVERNDVLGRRPSLFNLPSDSVLDIQADPDFVLQVDKLSDLLPHADRDVLARYLKRAGQDILAIGQYLEDEKNGAIRTD